MLLPLSGKNPKDFLYHEEIHDLFGNFRFDRNGDIVGRRFILKRVLEDGSSTIIPTEYPKFSLTEKARGLKTGFGTE